MQSVATHLLGELLGLGLDILNGTSHVEGRLRESVVGARQDLLEGTNGVLERDELALVTREDLGNLEGL